VTGPSSSKASPIAIRCWTQPPRSVTAADYHHQPKRGTGLRPHRPGHGVDDFHNRQKSTTLPCALARWLPAAPSRRKRARSPRPETLFSKTQRRDSRRPREGPAALLKQETTGPTYPYDWRTRRKPTIFRANRAVGFASVAGLRAEAMAAIASVSGCRPAGRQPDRRAIECAIGATGAFSSANPHLGRADPRVLSPLTTGGAAQCRQALITSRPLIGRARCRRLVVSAARRAAWPRSWPGGRIQWRKCSDTWMSGSTPAPPGRRVGGWEAWTLAKATGERILLAGPRRPRRLTRAPSIYPADLYLEGSDQPPRLSKSSLLTVGGRSIGQAPSNGCSPLASPPMRGSQESKIPWGKCGSSAL